MTSRRDNIIIFLLWFTAFFFCQIRNVKKDDNSLYGNKDSSVKLPHLMTFSVSSQGYNSLRIIIATPFAKMATSCVTDALCHTTSHHFCKRCG